MHIFQLDICDNRFYTMFGKLSGKSHVIRMKVGDDKAADLLKGDVFLSQGFAKQSEGACPAGIKQDAAFFAADKIGIGV